MSHNVTEPGCRIEVRMLSPDPSAPSSGPLLASAEPSGDGRWHMSHRDGRHVSVGTTVEVIERLVAVACDASLAERWLRQAALLPAGSERATTLRECAAELLPARPSTGASRGSVGHYVEVLYPPGGHEVSPVPDLVGKP